MAVPDSRTDAELIAAANRGDESAFESLYARYRDWVVGLAYRLTRQREDAFDVLQETFAYFFGKFPGFRLTAQVKTFLYPAVRHLALGRLRKRRPDVSFEDVGGESASDHRLETTGATEGTDADGSAMDALLGALSGADREIILLRFVDGMALKEIAAALEIPLGTVKSRLHNALERLRRDPRLGTYLEP